uniref:CX domain-containing protein n=1 Tax=Onchocerca volvulus TaxID=6282 RepID=A0A8R1TQI7_ONCVO
MDLLMQRNSIGIRYDGYDDEFIECVFEDSNVSGRNERYEFRCRPDLECCGRVCCIPQESGIPLWLMILFIILGLLLLLALLTTMAWFLRKIRKQSKKAKPRKTISDQAGYRSYKQNESQEGLGTENLIRKEITPNEEALRSKRGTRGYRNPLYTTTTSTVKIRETFDRTIDDGNVYDKAGTGTGVQAFVRSEVNVQNNDRKQLNTTGIRRSGYQVAEPTSLPQTAATTQGGQPSPGHYSTRETFEERCEENYVEEEKSVSEAKELL